MTSNTLGGVLFNGWRNDISCDIVAKRLVLAEHQSTLNCNMPLRFLLYIARVYEMAIKNQGNRIIKALNKKVKETIGKSRRGPDGYTSQSCDNTGSAD